MNPSTLAAIRTAIELAPVIVPVALLSLSRLVCLVLPKGVQS